jgi:hypothetical protein
MFGDGLRDGFDLSWNVLEYVLKSLFTLEVNAI